MSRLFLTVLAVVSFTGGAFAQLYELVPTQSQYTVGCLPPCLCPILLVGETVEGTFALEFVENDGTYDVYDVVDMDLVAINFMGQALPMTGAGTYRVDPLQMLHEMAIDLTVDGETFAMASDGFQPIDSTGTVGSLSFFLATSHECYGNHLSFTANSLGTPDFVRGDCNVDGVLDIGDAVSALAFLFVTGEPACDSACDANDDEMFDISDAIFSLSHLFTSGPPPAAPFPDCGSDPTAGALTCSSFSACP